MIADCPLAQQLANLLLNHFHLGLKRCPVQRSISHPVPQVEHLLRFKNKGASDLFGDAAS